MACSEVRSSFPEGLCFVFAFGFTLALGSDFGAVCVCVCAMVFFVAAGDVVGCALGGFLDLCCVVGFTPLCGQYVLMKEMLGVVSRETVCSLPLMASMLLVMCSRSLSITTATPSFSSAFSLSSIVVLIPAVYEFCDKYPKPWGLG